jgi:hypothetical protein
MQDEPPSAPAPPRSSKGEAMIPIVRTGVIAFVVFMYLFLFSDVMVPALAIAALVLVFAIAAYLNRSAAWHLRIVSAFSITAAFVSVGTIETLHTGIVPPQQLMLISTSIVSAGSLFSTLAGGGLISWYANRGSLRG